MIDPTPILAGFAAFTSAAGLAHKIKTDREARREASKARKWAKKEAKAKRRRDKRVAQALAEQKAIAEETRLAANRLKDALASARAEGARIEREKP